MTRLTGKLDAFMARGSGSGGYTRVPNFLLRRAKALGLDRSCLLVLMVLLSMRRGDTCCISIKRLSQDTMLSERAVKNCVRKMETLGLLEVDRQPYRYRKRRSNIYDLGPLVDAMRRSLDASPWKRIKHSDRAAPVNSPLTTHTTEELLHG